MPFWFEKELTGVNPTTLGLLTTFTKSNGTTLARIYERLTRASRRRGLPFSGEGRRTEKSYRQGVYDTLKALQQEVVN